ncbi:MAG: sensor histidine kinase, partial [Anaerolineae bacterium]
MHKSSAASFESELHTASPKMVIAVLLGVAALLAQWGDLLPIPDRAWNTALLLFLTAPLGLAIEAWRPAAGGWYALALLSGAIVVADVWFALPGVLTLLALPVALGAAFAGVPAAAMAAAAESGLLLLLLRAGHARPEAVAVALAGVWMLLAVMAAVYRPIHRLAAWAWEHFEDARALLEEARGRRAELQLALNDLALANRQLAVTNDRLAAARLLAESAQKTKAAFVANVSHEFRTPLNMIIGLTEFVLSRPDAYGRRLPAALLEDLAIIRRNSEHLAAMVNDVLDLSRVESGRMALHGEMVSLAEVIERALAVVRPLLAKKGLELAVDVPADLPEVFCDCTRIRQVVVNLLSNAVRFTDQGSIAVRASHEGGRVTVSVADTGPGIAPEEAARLFEPFHQAGGGSRGGSGLGLSISKQFVELHDGQMWLESEVGRGSTFHFRLPVTPPAGPVARPERWLAEGWVWTERTRRSTPPTLPPRPRLLVCDDGGALEPLLGRYGDEAELVAVADLAQAAGACLTGGVPLYIGTVLQRPMPAPAAFRLCNRLRAWQKCRLVDRPLLNADGELLQQQMLAPKAPTLGNRTIRDAHQLHPRHLYGSARRADAPVDPPMRAAENQARRDLVALGQQVFYMDIKVGKSGSQLGDGRAQAGRVGRLAGLRVVVHKVRREDSLQQVQIASVVNSIVEPVQQVLVLEQRHGSRLLRCRCRQCGTFCAGDGDMESQRHRDEGMPPSGFFHTLCADYKSALEALRPSVRLRARVDTGRCLAPRRPRGAISIAGLVCRQNRVNPRSVATAPRRSCQTADRL